MPLLKIQTNRELSPEQIHALLQEGTDLIVDGLSKPRDYVQVVVEDACAMAFAGDSDTPAAFVELRSLGLPGDTPAALSAAICGLLETRLGIPPKRVFINFFDLERAHWGWDGGTFG